MNFYNFLKIALNIKNVNLENLATSNRVKLKDYHIEMLKSAIRMNEKISLDDNQIDFLKRAFSSFELEKI